MKEEFKRLLNLNTCESGIAPNDYTLQMNMEAFQKHRTEKFRSERAKAVKNDHARKEQWQEDVRRQQPEYNIKDRVCVNLPEKLSKTLQSAPYRIEGMVVGVRMFNGDRTYSVMTDGGLVKGETCTTTTSVQFVCNW